jgi:GrpB-like predicted nucleotidyltransferase (UPF0157 family)
MSADGLERHPSLDDRFDPAVRIVDYDASWPDLAVAELRRIAEALGEQAVRIEHVGSTAVPGLAAKPIVDLQLSVPDVERRESYVELLEGLGYLFIAAPESPDYHFFALKRRLVASHPEDRLAYVDGKDVFVAALEQRALAWAPGG